VWPECRLAPAGAAADRSLHDQPPSASKTQPGLGFPKAARDLEPRVKERRAERLGKRESCAAGRSTGALIRSTPLA
jgi:hypothetical protein